MERVKNTYPRRGLRRGILYSANITVCKGICLGHSTVSTETFCLNHGINNVTSDYKTAFMISKEKLLKSLEEMPEQINVDDLLDRVLLMQKIEEGLSQSAHGQVISHDSLKNEMSEWFKSTGQPGQKKI